MNRGVKALGVLAVLGGLGAGAYAMRDSELVGRLDGSIQRDRNPVPGEAVAAVETGGVTVRESFSVLESNAGETAEIDVERTTIVDASGWASETLVTGPETATLWAELGTEAESWSAAEDGTWTSDEPQLAPVVPVLPVAMLHHAIGFELRARADLTEVDPASSIDPFAAIGLPTTDDAAAGLDAITGPEPPPVTRELSISTEWWEIDALVPMLDRDAVDSIGSLPIPEDADVDLVLGFDAEWTVRTITLRFDADDVEPDVDGSRVVEYRYVLESLDTEPWSVSTPVAGTFNDGFPGVGLELPVTIDGIALP